MTTGNPAPTVFIVDDDPAVCRALQFAVKTAGMNVEIYIEGHEFLENLAPHSAGCVVLDVRMPGMSGLDLQAVLTARKVQMPVIMLTGHGDVPMAVRALKQGAFDFLEKPVDNAVLLECIRRAINCNSRMEWIDGRYRNIAQRIASLNSRQQAILDSIVKGHSNKRIAASLKLSIATIENQRKQIMDKLQAKTRSELVHMVLSLRTHTGSASEKH